MRNSTFDVSEILPYQGDQVASALKRVSGYPVLGLIGRFLFSTWTQERFFEVFRSIHSVESFQDLLVGPAVKSILGQTSKGVEITGFDSLEKDETCLFVSNHRDIVLDPAIFAFYLRGAGFPTVKVALGDNLLVNDWVTDLIKLNKSLIVKRSLKGRQQFFALKALSEVIQSQVCNGEDSVWIAQREGRSKDGLDRTQSAVLKMLALSRGEGESVWSVLSRLRITPVTMSYEYDPCDVMKALEILERSRVGDAYQKAPNADFESMLAGIQGHKGRIGMHVGHRLEWSRLNLEGKAEDHSDETVIEAVRKYLDQEILGGFRVFASHASAWLMLNPGRSLPDSIAAPSEVEQNEFQVRLMSKLQAVPERDRDYVRDHVLTQYANAVISEL